MPVTVAVIADDRSFGEFVSHSFPANVEISRLNDITELRQVPDACFDLRFHPGNGLDAYQEFFPLPFFLHAVETTSSELQKSTAEKKCNIARVNAWPGFISKNLLEIATPSGEHMEVLKKMNWQYSITPDVPGFISARVIAMIINEAWLALEEKVSTKNEIDTAMKLGTNYPHGPFEWCELIGSKNIHSLLSAMEKENPRYKPAPLLTKEASR
jgi:3-hydroxybutyryl-CoA dehydrogenase